MVVRRGALRVAHGRAFVQGGRRIRHAGAGAHQGTGSRQRAARSLASARIVFAERPEAAVAGYRGREATADRRSRGILSARSGETYLAPALDRGGRRVGRNRLLGNPTTPAGRATSVV